MPEFSEELVMRLYRTMYTIRSFEEKVSEEQQNLFDKGE